MRTPPTGATGQGGPWALPPGGEGAVRLWLFSRVAAQHGGSRAGSGLGGMPLSPSPAAKGVGGCVVRAPT